MKVRKLFLPLLTLAVVTGLSVPFICPGLAARAADPARSTVGGNGPTKDELDDKTKAAVKKGLDYLKTRVQVNGQFADEGGNSVAIVSLAGIAFLANGSMPDDGPYGDVTTKILGYVLDNCQPSGLVSSASNGEPMYGHGFATLFLSEVYGMSHREDVGEKLRNAIRLIVDTQYKAVKNQGGWRYQAMQTPPDISVTICQVMALRAARNAGVEVPNSTIQDAIDYVRASQLGDGGFCYTPNSGGSAFPRSAAGVACLYYMRTGEQFGDEIQRGVAYLKSQTASNLAFNQGNYFYGNYYATQAMFMYGGDAWDGYWPMIRNDLLNKQGRDGAWTGETGPVYCTSMALIMLQVPNRLLPILQK